jgi:UrcA family protein
MLIRNDFRPLPLRPRSGLARSLCLALCVVIASAALAPPASAADTVTVRTSDLDLSSATGARTLLRRLERAADIVCDGAFARQYMATRRGFRECYRSTLSDAVSRG